MGWRPASETLTRIDVNIGSSWRNYRRMIDTYDGSGTGLGELELGVLGRKLHQVGALAA